MPPEKFVKPTSVNFKVGLAEAVTQFMEIQKGINKKLEKIEETGEDEDHDG